MASNASDRLAAGQVALVALFVTALVTAQLTASKLLAFELPFELPTSDTDLTRLFYLFVAVPTVLG